MSVFVASVFACFLAGDLIKAMGATPEWTRKVVHMGACLCIVLYPYFGVSSHELAVIAAGFAVFLYLCRGTWVTRSIAYVDRRSFGEVMIPISVFITCLFEVNYLIFLCAYLVLGLSDSLASLVGQRFGVTPLPFLRHRKTYVGSIAFFSSCIVVFVLVSWLGEVISWPVALQFVVLAAILTLVEAISNEGLDNFTVPVASALGMSQVLQVGA